MAAFSRAQQSLETEVSVAVDKKKQKQRKVRIDASSYAFQDSDADDDSDKDAEGEEDGDFEAPAVDITRITETLSFVNPTPHVAEGVMDKRASTAGKVSAIENIDEAENTAVDIAASKTVVPGAKRMLQSSSTDDNYQSKHNACKLVQELFPPANFRNVNKRTQLASFINWTAH
ncbi:hypothetical protein GGI11_004279 [Coemansia sp. RSA 2049]|nr:hypothetical protein GGI11_004279 [Coemansia sp. RSA 2049]